MANTLSGSRSIDQDNRTITYTDTTTYSSPVRASVGVFFKVFKVNSDGSTEEVTSTDNVSDPETVVSTVFEIEKDGWYQILHIAPQDYAGGTSYSRYDAVFDPTSDKVYVSQQDANIGQSLNDTDYWVEDPDPTTLALNVGLYNEAANLDSLVFNTVIGSITREERDIYSVDVALECCTDCERDKQVDKFTLLDVFSVALEAAEEYDQYAAGEKIARRAEALIADL
jgi:hypothetical protein